MVNIQSTAVTGVYMREIMDKTIRDIHSTVTTVFGPYATDAYIKKNDQLYYTRDGKEVMASMHYDNELANSVLQMIYQAVHHQGTRVGDGTTTLGVLYTNLYMILREYLESGKFTSTNISHLRPMYNKIIARIVDELKSLSKPLEVEDLKSMIYTCTQDPKLVNMFYDNLKEPIMNGAYIVASKSNMDDELAVTVHDNPLIKADKQFSLFPVPDSGVMENVTTYFCNGSLDISEPLTLLGLAAKQLYTNDSLVKHNIMLLCGGITENTRKALKTFKTEVTKLKESGTNIDDLCNIMIYTIRDFRSLNSEMVEDLVTYLYEEEGIGGLVQPVTFESYLYQSLVNTDIIGGPIEALEGYDCDPYTVQKIVDTFCDMGPITIDTIEGIRFGKPMGPKSEARYNELRNMIENEKSPIKQRTYRDRLKALYGQFVEVEVGSRLLKDGQRIFELMLDAIVSSAEAVRHGAIHGNSILHALNGVKTLLAELKSASPDEVLLLEAIESALTVTMDDMIFNRTPDVIMSTLAEKYYYDTDGVNLVIPEAFNLTRENIEDVFNPACEDRCINIGDSEIKQTIVEPLTIITTLLENSTMMLELATARVFNLSTFMMNYI